jgi:F-type H+-transporting ATPase subunit b
MRALILGLLLLTVAPATLAAAEAEHHGPLRAEEVFSNPQFWAAGLNFVLLLVILRKMGKRPLSEFLVNRRQQMERGMTEAAEMKSKAEAKYEEYQGRLKTLDQELATLRRDIERAAEEDKRRIVAEAEETARRFKHETESLIDQYAKALSNDVRREVVEAAVAAAEKLLREAMNESDQQRLADGFRQRVARPVTRPEGTQ